MLGRTSRTFAAYATVDWSSGRLLRLALLAAASAIAFAPHLKAQGMSRFELRPVVGAWIPTGGQRDFLKDAVLVGGQLSWVAIPRLAITGSFAWSPSKDRLTSGDQTIDVAQYDVGAEYRASPWFGGETWSLSPRVGLGLGGRTYSYRDLDIDSQSNLAGYAALGSDFDWQRVGLRIEARNYVSGFKPLTGNGESETRNDVTVGAGLSIRF